MSTSETSEQMSFETKPISWRIWEPKDASEIHGFDGELMLVRNLFQRKEDEDTFKAIGIVGVQGIGKSTLCRKILETPDIRADYFPRIWISVPRNPTDLLEALVKNILVCFGFDQRKLDSISRNGNLEDLLYVLHLQLSGKRYLIVLDDVRKAEDWLTNLNCRTQNRHERHLADGLPMNGGGRVIITSRSSVVAEAMVGEENLHKLLPFSDPESFWKIYEKKVENCGIENDLHDPELKQELLEKCRGVPFIAQMLRELKQSKS